MTTKTMETTYCERCHEKLNPAKIVWLELDQDTGRYVEKVPEGHASQGGFPFGSACAKRVLATDGIIRFRRR